VVGNRSGGLNSFDGAAISKRFTILPIQTLLVLMKFAAFYLMLMVVIYGLEQMAV
jgi:hypothetical protein